MLSDTACVALGPKDLTSASQLDRTDVQKCGSASCGLVHPVNANRTYYIGGGIIGMKYTYNIHLCLMEEL